MSILTSRRRTARLVLATGTAALLAAATLLSTSADALTRTVTYRPSLISFSGRDVGNTMRGQYQWMGQATQPAGAPGGDIYSRDTVYWGRIEPQQGAYDFSYLDDGLNQAGATNSKFGFRVMAYCPGCWMNGRSDWPSVTPSYIPLQPGTDIPNWNSEQFLSSWEQLMQQLGQRYDHDPRLGWVDVGGFGMYGEWHMDGHGKDITAASERRVVMAVLNAFPDKQVSINAMVYRYVTRALALSPRLGLRMDCLGGDNMFWLWDNHADVRNRWKTAPTTSEWCTFGNTQLGARQVVKYHVSQVSSGNLSTPYAQMSAAQKAGYNSAVKHAGYRYQVRGLTVPTSVRSGAGVPMRIAMADTGSAPTYDKWISTMQLRNSSGQVVASGDMHFGLSGLRPGSHTYSRTLNFGSVPPGSYSVAVIFTDPSGYAKPMRLANVARTPDGAYTVGRLRITQ